MIKKLSLLVISLTLLTGLMISCNKDASPTGSSASTAAVGTWVSASSDLDYVFNSNGSITGSAVDAMNALLVAFGGAALTWTFDATDVYINGAKASPYTVSENTLRMKDSEGNDITLTRK